MANYHTAQATMLKLAVVEGGPVGCVQALTLGRQGYSVDLYECRKDIRKECEPTFEYTYSRCCMAVVCQFNLGGEGF